MELDDLYHLVEEITEDFTANVVLFLANYVLSQDKKSLINQALDSSKRLKPRSTDILGFYCSYTEESSAIETDSPAANIKALLQYEVYQAPFVAMDMPYFSQMQMGLQFKQKISEAYGLNMTEVRKQEPGSKRKSKLLNESAIITAEGSQQ